MGKLFKELAKARIQDKRKVVISKDEHNQNYTIAQQILVEEGKKSTTLFLKGAFHIDSLDGLYNLRDAINEAIRKEEDGS